MNYNPRGKPWWRLLKDWQSIQYQVGLDLDQLKNSWFNFVHLYLWDQPFMSTLNEPLGVGLSYPDPQGDPSTLANLASFVGMLKSRQMYVALHFVRFKLRSDRSDPLTASNWESRAMEYSAWVDGVINYLTPNFDNVLMWGLAWQLEPRGWPSDPAQVEAERNNEYSKLFKRIYQSMDTTARARSPRPGVLGLVGIELTSFGANLNEIGTNDLPIIVPRASAWSWQPSIAKQVVTMIRDLLDRDADIYCIQLYNANGNDLVTGLTGYGGLFQGVDGIGASQAFVNEFAAASSWPESWASGSPPLAGVGDKQVPYMTKTGQNDWMRATLCAFRAAGIDKYAHWARFDAGTYFSNPPWSLPGRILAWYGNWALDFEVPVAPGQEKLSWFTAASFAANPSGFSCPVSATPSVALSTDDDYYTIGQHAALTWNVANFQSMDFNLANYGISRDNPRSCYLGPESGAISGVLDVSCGTAFAPTMSNAAGFSSVGYFPIRLTALNGASAPYADAPIQVYDKPQVLGIGRVGGGAITPSSTIEISGRGFSPGVSSVWFFDGSDWVSASVAEGTSFIVNTRRTITINLLSRLSPGQWTALVDNGNGANASTPVTFTVQ